MTASVSMSYAKSRVSRTTTATTTAAATNNALFPKIPGPLLSPSTSFNHLDHDERQHHTSGGGDASDGYVVSLVNGISSVAAYNRSIDHNVVYKEEGDASSDYLSTGHPIREKANHMNNDDDDDNNDDKMKKNSKESSQAYVYVSIDYDRMMSSVDGHVFDDAEDGSYVYPDDSYICGYTICDSPSTASTLPSRRDVRPPSCMKKKKKMMIVSMTTKNDSIDSSTRGRSKNDYLPVRHPLMGKKKLSLLRVE